MSEEDLTRFSRAAFERSARPAELCDELQEVLGPRLTIARDRSAEAYAIARDLRRAGHALSCWDEAEDLSVWGGDEAGQADGARLRIEMRWPAEGRPCQAIHVFVTYGSGPKDAKEPP